MNTPVAFAFFDIDGTLVDSMAAHTQASFEFLEQHEGQLRAGTCAALWSEELPGIS